MKSNNSLTRMFGAISLTCSIVLTLAVFSANAQETMPMPMPSPTPKQTPSPTPTSTPKATPTPSDMNMPATQPTPMSSTTDQQSMQTDAAQMGSEGAEIPHPFFTHMGVPEGVGVYSLRIVGLANRVNGATKGDFGFHFETGLTKRIGLHVRNDSYLNRTRSEIMFQFLAIKSKDGMSGFSPIIEFEIPTRTGGGSRVNTLVGFSTAWVNKRAAFNQVVHYNPREDSVDYSAAIVFPVTKRVFPVFEVLGMAMRGARPVVNLLGGLKVRMNKTLILGFGVQAPLTSERDFSSQSVFGSDLGWQRN